jgi:sterol desaturase/sphingolipid hydroxylase (fatty acid hydroxylase superfamily)
MVLHFLSVAAVSGVFTELVGYWLHVLLHSEKIPFLSRNHMIHHLVVYPPNRAQRPSGEYRGSTDDRAALLGIGLEWLVPSGLILSGLLVLFRCFSIRLADQAVFIGIALAWGTFMFGYMHDAMHLKGFWMEKSRVLGRWLADSRRRHDIHHMDLAADGRMDKNYGICLFWFDRLFGSFADRHVKFDREALEAARKRYAFIFPKPEEGCSPSASF